MSSRSVEKKAKFSFVSLAEHVDSNSKESSSIFNESERENDEHDEHFLYGSLNNEKQIEINLEPNQIRLADDEESINKKKKKNQIRLDEIRSAMEHDGDCTWSL